VEAAVNQFLSAKLSEAQIGSVSAGRFDNVARDLRWFREYGGAGLDGASLAGFVQHLSRRVAAAELASCSASCCLATVRQFVRWCYRQEILHTLPRNLEDVRITAFAPELRILSVAEFTAIVEAATPALRLPILLMANCGFTQQDVADLAPDEVDWSCWRISRKRSKTRRWDGVPKVTYPLWPATAALLEERGRRDGPTVLCCRGGQPLKRTWINDQGKLSKVDAIGRNYQRLLRRIGLRNVPLKLIRKTSASLLESHGEYGRYAPLFLGHAPRSIAARHYVVPSQDRFDDAVLWLGTLYGQTVSSASA
jgi:integrase